MSKIALSGDASGTGTFTIASPNSNSNFTLTLPQASTTVVGTDATQTLTNKTIDGSQLVAASVTSTQLATAVQPIGVGQTWQNVTGSRASGTTYTNTTGRPIMVTAYSSSSPSNGQSIQIAVSGTTIAYGFFAYTTNQWVNTVYAIVPNGGTYVVSVGSTSLGGWFELR